MSRRTERVAEMIRQIVGRMVVSELNDPRIGFVTVTRVEVSPDLSLAKVFVSIMGEPEKGRSALRGLQSSVKRIRAKIGEEMELRHTPEIAFFNDPGVQRSLKIGGILTELSREREEREGHQDGQETPQGEQETPQDEQDIEDDEDDKEEGDDR